MSKVASSVVLGGQERRFKRNVDSQVQDGFRYGHGWSHSVLHIRYIDDILLASTIYCHHCLAFATTRIYTVPCDISEASSNTLVWLDMKLFLDTGSLGLHTKPLCPAPPWHAGVQYLRSLLLGRFRRWSVICPIDSEWRRACCILLQDLKDCSWSYRRVSFVLRSIYAQEYRLFVGFCLHAWRTMRSIN